MATSTQPVPESLAAALTAANELLKDENVDQKHREEVFAALKAQLDVHGTSDKPPSLFDRIRSFLVGSEDAQEEEEMDPEPLSLTALRLNKSRFVLEIQQPVIQFIGSVKYAVSWDSPLLTGICFSLYMTLVWTGYLLPFVFLSLIFQLFALRFSSAAATDAEVLVKAAKTLPPKEESPDDDQNSAFRAFAQVAQTVQNQMGDVVVVGERARNLLYWREPYHTNKLMQKLLIGFLGTLFLSGSTLLLLAGIALGLRVFVIAPLMERNPSLNRRFGKSFLLQVPSYKDLLAKKRKQQALPAQASSESIGEVVEPSEGDDDEDEATALRLRFSLPESEHLLHKWRCLLVSDGKNKQGRLHLTSSFVVVYPTSGFFSNDDREYVVSLKDITAVRRYKQLKWAPGSGMGIEIVTKESSLKLSGLFFCEEVMKQIADQAHACGNQSITVETKKGDKEASGGVESADEKSGEVKKDK